MKDNCSTILCWFLPYVNMNQSQVYACPLPLEPLSYFPPHPIPLGCYRAPARVPWVIQQVPIDYVFCVRRRIRLHVTFSICPTLSSPTPVCPSPIFPPLITASLFSTYFTLILGHSLLINLFIYYKLKLYHFSCTAHLSICTAHLWNKGSAPVFEAGETGGSQWNLQKYSYAQIHMQLLSTRDTGG